MANVIKPFLCDQIEKTTIRLEWERWLRALDLYFASEEIVDSTKKKNKLLHYGGVQLQEVVYNLPGALDFEGTEGSRDDFEQLKEKLTKYFSPEQNTTFERHLFRDIRPRDGEEFSKFILRSRLQLSKCSFGTTEQEFKDICLKDKIIDCWAKPDLKKRLLEKEYTLKEVISMCTVYEQVGTQSRLMNSDVLKDTISVNQIKKNYKESIPYMSSQDECNRCGLKSHLKGYKECPALKVRCHKCDLIGHYARRCKTKTNKRKSDEPMTNFNDKRPRLSSSRVRYIGDMENQPLDIDEEHNSELNNCFKIQTNKKIECDESDIKIKCKIGGQLVTMVIDSGCKSNLISMKDSELLESLGANFWNVRGYSNNVFRAYATKDPLKVLKVFESPISISESKESIETFYVIENSTQSLLGRETAVKLGVLRYGLDVRQISHSILFPMIEGIKVKLTIDDSVKPVSQPVRRIPVGLEKQVDDKLQQMLNERIIEKVDSFSEWISPLVIVTKDETHAVRICTDMRMANRAIKRENYPFPTFDSIVAKLKGANFFSRLDLKSAYYQLELAEESRPITTFITHQGLFRYTRLFFGVNSAPEIFQKVFEGILAGTSGCINYLDDVIVFGHTVEEHDTNLKALLEIFKQRKVTLNESKCQYKVKELKFLGHIIGNNGISPDPEKVKTILEFRAPQTKEETRSFLGLVTYLGKFIPDLASTTEPLWQLLKKNENFKWNKERETAFEKLKMNLTEIPKLSYFDISKKTRLIADASPVALGAVLLQFDEQGNVKVISFASRALSEIERRYSQTEKESLALVWAVERFYFYLAGITFELITDHRPLEAIFKPSSRPPARIERWLLRLQAYKFKVIYKSGKENIADSLSRLCKLNDVTFNVNQTERLIYSIVENAVPTALSISEISMESAKDEELGKIKQCVISCDWNSLLKSPFYPFRHELSLLGNIMLRGDRLVIPINLRERILQLAHEAHPGESVMKRRLRSKVWWPLIDRDAERTVKQCRDCLLVARPDHPPPMNRTKFPDKAWTHLAIDLLGPLPSTSENIVVLIDYFSRYVELKFLKNTKSIKIIEFLDDIFSRHGYPKYLRADNGPQFISKEFQEYCELNDITINHSPPLWPQANGLVENMNQSLDKRLKIAYENKLNYRTEINKFILMYNSTPHGTTGIAPSELLFNRKVRDKIPSFQDLQFDSGNSHYKDCDILHKQQGKEKEDRRRAAKESNISIGDHVLMKHFGPTHKLSTNFDNTEMVVIDIQGNEATIERDGKTFKRHLNYLKKIHPQVLLSNKQDSSSDTISTQQIQPSHRMPSPLKGATDNSQIQDSSKIQPLKLKKIGGMWQSTYGPA